MLFATPSGLPASAILEAAWLSPADLRAIGISRRAASELIEGGRLIRLRRGRSVPSGTPAPLLQAGSLGGRLDCVSLLHTLGIFVRHHSGLHVQFEREASRLPQRRGSVIAHWRDTPQPRAALSADLIGAVAQAVQCQPPRDAIATLDSALHHRLIDDVGLAEVFAQLPRRFRRLLPLVDGRCESGPETLMRLMLRGLGCRVELQVSLDGVGRVDFIVDDWLIIECDSRAHHDGWDAHRRDRRRDIASAALGYTTIRPLAEDILARPESVLALVKAVLAHRRSLC